MKKSRHFIIKISIIFIFLVNFTAFDSVSSQKGEYGSESISYVYSENEESGGVLINYTGIELQIRQTQDPDNDENWYETKIEMLIIASSDDHASAMAPLAEWKTSKGVPTKIINASEYQLYNGRDTAERIRNCIKDYYLNYGIKWVLLAGDTEFIPIREVKNPDSFISSEDHEEYGSEIYKPTDYYYAELSGNWDLNGNDIFGESLIYSNADEIDWNTEVYVGRFPGKSAYDLSVMVNKTIFYEQASNPGNWMNQILLAGAVQGKIGDVKDLDGEEESFLINKIAEESIQSSMGITKLIETNYPISGYRWTNFTHDLFKQKIDEGNSIVMYAGHGDTDSYDGMLATRTFFKDTDALGTINNEMPSLFYADACSTNFFDGPEDSLGEILIKKERGGAIGYIGGLRITWFFRNDTYDFGDGENLTLVEMNRGMARLFFQEMFLNGNYQQGKALYEMKRSYINSRWLKENPWVWVYDGITYDYNIHYIEWERKNVLTYTLLGDPETDIFTDIPKNFNTNISSRFNNRIEGQEFIITVLDEENNTVPQARISIVGEYGAYNYFVSNSDGKITIRLPKGVQQYNYTITAHNMIVLKGSFNTNPDENPPIFDSALSLNPTAPTADINIIALLNASDLESGVSRSYLVLSTDGFNTYNIHAMNLFQDDNCFRAVLPKLNVGVYSYITFIFDYGGNSNHTFYSDANRFQIPIPISSVFIIMINSALLIGLTWFIIRKKSLVFNYSRHLGTEKSRLDNQIQNSKN